MLNTTNHIHQDNTLAVSERIANNQRIDRLKSEMQKMVSVDNFKQAMTISEEFKKDLIFKIYKEENTGINFIAWRHPSDPYSVFASFTLNNKQHTVSFSSAELSLSLNSPRQLVNLIIQKISEELASSVLISILEK